ncbi:unnamed protein product, partial [Porites lobata]
MEKLLQVGKEFGLEGERLLELIEKQQKLEEERKWEEKEEKRRKLEEERRREEEEKEEKRRQLEEEKDEKRRLLEEQKEEKPKRCFVWGKQGHEGRNCRLGGRKSGGQCKDGNPAQRGQVSAGCLVKSPDLKATPEEVKSCIQDDQLLLTCGKKVPLLSNACVEPLTGVRSKMPVVKGRVGEK